PLAGQVAEDPVHFAATEQVPVEVPQTVVAGAKPLAGQVAEDPVHFAATEQVPVEVPQTFVAAANPSAGQVSAVPLHVSATSHTPADPRQLAPLALGEQVPALPKILQLPQRSVQAVLQQTPPEAQWLLVH
ncbi:MAG TPA: hypothetical protein VKJ01_01865, partial [Candidatus Solibacter sp.]|nr:hypothetical protein [Candidatus Solibacter sp.]